MLVRRYRIYVVLALLVAFGGLGAALATDASPRLGLDLEGGTSVILTAEGEGAEDEAVLNKTVEVIRQRIDALGVAEPEVSIAGANNVMIQLPGVEDEERALELIGTTAQLTFRQVEEIIPPGRQDQDENDGEVPEVTEATGPDVSDQEVVYPSADEGEEGVLYRLAPAVLTGEVVRRAEAVPDPDLGVRWSVSLDMDQRGARIWAEFTSDLACLRDEGEQEKSQVAIVLDGRVESAAGMRSPLEAGAAGGGVECGAGIRGGSTSIDVGDQQEARDLALVLRFGSLPVQLEQSEVRKVSATLGRDSLEAGVKAGILGLTALLIYMFLYYRALGMVVGLGLLLFTAAMYALLALLGETTGLALTLAGVAGIIVAIGITADSFIVAFERLKDEIRAGKSMRAAVERGTGRAVQTMLIADFVTGAAAVILFMLAVGPVRGFALTLGLATAIDVLLIWFFIRPSIVLLSRSKFFMESRFIGLKQAIGAPVLATGAAVPGEKR